MNKWIAMGMAVFFLTGCAPVVISTRTPRPAPAPHKSVPPPRTAPRPSPQVTRPPVPKKPPRKRSAREIAALELTAQGRMLIQKRRPDAAIRTLERAMNLYPQNGQIYFYLAEAWLQKGNIEQAAEYNKTAQIYLRKDPIWAGRLAHQQQRIKRQ